MRPAGARSEFRRCWGVTRRWYGIGAGSSAIAAVSASDADHRYGKLFGRHEPSGSLNVDNKSRPWNGRWGTLRHLNGEFNNIAYQVHALATHHNRTGAAVTRWFGRHRVAAARPLVLAA